MIRVERPGFWTTIQDHGRYGLQRLGVIAGGASDPFSARVANALVGNNAQAAVIEMIMAGPRLSFEKDAIIAWCGADLDAEVDGGPLPKNRPVFVTAGGVLDFSAPKHGTTAWMAVAGGIAVPEVMGSRSTDLTAKIGGLEGRRLAAGDGLPLGSPSGLGKTLAEILATGTRPVNWSVQPERLGAATELGVLRVMRGPEWNWFTPQAQERFLKETYTVTRESNRMGARLAGAPLELAAQREMISSAVNHGIVQVPSAGQPILLGADRHTIGGYPRIAGIATVDLGRLAQLRPGDTVRFIEISLANAHANLLERERDFAMATQYLEDRISHHAN